LPGFDEERHAPPTVNSTGISPGAEVEPDICCRGRLGGYPKDIPGVNAAGPLQVGIDVKDISGILNESEH